MDAGGGRGRGRGAGWATIAVVLLLLGGCTAESLRVALEAQQRADQVQQAVFQRQHDGLRVLLYRDLSARLERAGGLNAAQRAEPNAAWNERDLMEFWLTQHERARALRLAGVTAKLYSEQAMLDLLYKQVSATLDRGLEAAAAQAGRAAADAAADGGS